MSVQSGKDGTVYIGADEAQPTGQWSLRRFAGVAKYVANDTDGVHGAEPGAKDSNGSFRMYDKPAFDEGAKVAFFGWTGSASVLLDVLITEIAHAVDFKGGTEPVAYDVTFEGRGAITDGSTSSPA